MCKTIPISKNKTLEIQIDYFKDDKSSIVEFHFDLTRNRDHAGMDFRITVWKFFFNIHFYDNRHWYDGKDD